MVCGERSENHCIDRGLAGIVANRQRHRHRHRIGSPGQTGLLRRSGERESLGSRRRDQSLQIDAIDRGHEAGIDGLPHGGGSPALGGALGVALAQQVLSERPRAGKSLSRAIGKSNG